MKEVVIHKPRGRRWGEEGDSNGLFFEKYILNLNNDKC